MDHNPYAPLPVGAQTPSAPPLSLAGEWSIANVISIAWNLYKRRWLAISLSTLIGMFFMSAPAMAGIFIALRMGNLPGTPTFDRLSLFLELFGLFWVPMFEAGMYRQWVVVARGGNPKVSQIFSESESYGRYLGLRLLVGLPYLILRQLAPLQVRGSYDTINVCLQAVGVVVFVILHLRGLVLAGFYVVDAGQDPRTAIVSSLNAIAGERAKFAGFIVAAICMAFGGYLLCGGGLLVAWPVVHIAGALIYLQLRARLPAEEPSSEEGETQG